MEPGVIPSSPLSFAQTVTAPLAALLISLLPLRHRRRRNYPAPAVVPRRRTRLAKKAASHPPTVVAAQNLLMKRHGLLSDGKVDTVSFDRYVKLFADGLSEPQAELIAGLFAPQLQVRLHYLHSFVDWWLMSIYGPANDDLKPAFLQELSELCPLRSGSWLLTGDFNMIYRVADKNNEHLNLRQMGRFRHFLNDASLKELHLERRLFMWSNEILHLTLERIDRAFVSRDWDELYPNCDLCSLALGC
jgi:hypothetical protein